MSQDACLPAAPEPLAPVPHSEGGGSGPWSSGERVEVQSLGPLPLKGRVHVCVNRHSGAQHSATHDDRHERDT